MRITRQRKEILKILQDSKDHPSADIVYERVRNVLPRISLGTVYRNLDVLVNKGQILCLTGGLQNRYDGDITDHLHFRCIACGALEDIYSDAGQFKLSEAEAEGRLVKGVTIEYFGLCASCRKNGN